ncbi:MAG TPA: efflux RND transporter periplasmic adaptor subunit [Pantanalinema sp.]
MKPLFLGLVTLLLLVGCSKQADPRAPQAAEATASEEVTLPEASRRLVTLETARVSRRSLVANQAAIGQIVPRPEGQSMVLPTLKGHLVRLHAKVGDRVAAGAALATLKSTELGEAQAVYLRARSEAELCGREVERVKKLIAAEVAATKDLEAARQRLDAARVTRAEARERLRLMGLADAEVAALEGRGRIDPLVVLRAPLAGTVVERTATVGQYVTPEAQAPLFALIDLSTVRVRADLAEKDFLSVRPGQVATVSLAAVPGKAYRGKVVRLSPTLDAESRTGEALVDLPNPDGGLRPGMSVKVSIAFPRPGVLSVPLTAVQREDARAYAYTPLGGDRYKEVALKLGDRYGDYVEVLEGLSEGMTVISRGSFDLRAQARKDLFGGEE